MRSVLSPVLLHEAVAASRRWQGYALRSLLVVLMLVTIVVAWLNIDWPRGPYGDSAGATTRYLAEIGQAFYLGVAGIQVTLALLAAPAAAAGAICVDRSRGWLEHMLVTGLSNTEIVLGKLAARLATLLAFVLSGVPVLALASLLGGIVPEAVLLLTVVTVVVCLLGCSLALFVSVRAESPHEALTIVLAVLVAWLLVLPLWIMLNAAGVLPTAPDWLALLNPYVLTFAPYVRPASLTIESVATFLGLHAAASLIFVALAIRTLRRETGRSRPPSPKLQALRAFVRSRLFSWWPVPELDRDPICWREWHRTKPSMMMRLVGWLFVGLTTIGLACGVVQAIRDGVQQGDLLVGVSTFAVGFALLLLSARAPTVLTEERLRGSLDILMTTPLSTPRIVLGKWWATCRRMLPLLVLPAFTGIFVASATTGMPGWLSLQFQRHLVPVAWPDRVLAGLLPSLFAAAHVALIASLGLALATWIRRTGPAIAVSVAAYVSLTFGWILFVELVISRIPGSPFRRVHELDEGYNLYHSLEQGLAALSPMAGQANPLSTLVNDWNHSRWPTLCFMLGTVVVLFLASGAILGLTILTFNGCMGRVGEGRERKAPRQAPVDPAASPSPSCLTAS